MRPLVHRAWEDSYSVIEPQINVQMVHRWPFSAEFPVDLRFLKFDRRRGIRLNRHDYFEVLYLYCGEVVYEVQGRLLPMKRGDLLVIGSAQLHRSISQGPGSVKAALLASLPGLMRGAETTGDDFPHVVPSATGIPAQVFDSMPRAAGDLPAVTHRSRVAVKANLKMILVRLGDQSSVFRGSKDVSSRKHADPDRLAPLFAFIDGSYSEPISVEQAALAAGMSKSSLMRFFKQAAAIAKAEALLAATDKTIAEIGQEVGFCEQSYVGLVFRHVMGVSPRDYKSRRNISAAVGQAISVGREARRVIQ